MRFLHTSDWHAGMPYTWVGAAASSARQARLDVLRSLAALAGSERVDFCLVAGDMFDNHEIAVAGARGIVDIVETFPCPVYVIPGNHDPDCPGSLWNRLALEGCNRFRLLRTTEPAAVPGGAILPCPVSRRWSSANPLDEIGERPGDGICIALAHGSLEMPGVGAGAIRRDSAERLGLDYIALGDWHSTSIHGRIAYSGSPELTAIDDRDAGNVLIVDIEERGRMPEISKRRCGLMNVHTIERRIGSAASIVAVADELRALASPYAVLRLTLKGSLPSESSATLASIEALCRDGFLHARVDTSHLLPEGSNRPLPAYFETVRSKLQQQAASGTADALAAQRALSLLEEALSEVAQ